MRVILCGLPCSGKSTVGLLLAKTLKWPFFDTDRELEKAYKDGHYSCREIYQQEGEELFRLMESEVIHRLFAKAPSHSVISLGGGGLTDHIALSLQKEDELCYLDIPFEILWERLERRGLPAYLLKESYPKDLFLEICETRSAIFNEWASMTLSGKDHSPSEMVAMILEQEIFCGLK